MGRAAQEQAARRFAAEIIVPAYEALYRRVVDRDPVGLPGPAL
jgi:hypothetical protein